MVLSLLRFQLLLNIILKFFLGADPEDPVADLFYIFTKKTGSFNQIPIGIYGNPV